MGDRNECVCVGRASGMRYGKAAGMEGDAAEAGLRRCCSRRPAQQAQGRGTRRRAAGARWRQGCEPRDGWKAAHVTSRDVRDV